MTDAAPPESNPFFLRKADDLEEVQIEQLFVEPNEDFLWTTASEKVNHILLGGRGSGKTITLRKLSYPLSPPNRSFPFLGVYLCLDVNQFAPFDESKIGSSSAWLFEAYLAGC